MNNQTSKSIDDILDDIYTIGKNDQTLDVNDWDALRPGVKKKLLQLLLDVAPKEKIVVKKFNNELITEGYNQAIDDYLANIREVFK